MKLQIILLIFCLLISLFECKNHHHISKKLNNNLHTNKIHPKYRQMMWNPKWGDKDRLTDDGSAEPGVIHSQFQKIEEYRRENLKRGLNLLKRPREAEGRCKSERN